jgi:hypothetical protein
MRHHLPSIGLLLLTAFGLQQKNHIKLIFSENGVK